MRQTLVVVCLLAVVQSASVTPSVSADARASAGQRQPTFTVNVDLVTTDVIVRDARGQFIADLKAADLEVYEDGVKQEVSSLVMFHGGRQFNVLSLPIPVKEGIILPASRPTSDAAGRIFLIVIDDFHFEAASTPRVREIVGMMLRDLIHEGDMFGIVSTGHSSIREQLTYDRQVLDSAIERIHGGGLSARDIIEGPQGSQGPTELRHRAHVAFQTAYELIRNLEKVQNRRKAVIYISTGYDFNPFETARLEAQALRMQVQAADLQSDPFFRMQQGSQQLAEADLIRELAELTRAANRANATIYTIDPRGLTAGPDVDSDVKVGDWNAFVRDSQDSLRVMAEETGGFALVNRNDFSAGLKRIDNETSDYYVLGYYSSDPDPLRRVRRIDVKTTRSGAVVFHRTSYTRASESASKPR